MEQHFGLLENIVSLLEIFCQIDLFWHTALVKHTCAKSKLCVCSCHTLHTGKPAFSPYQDSIIKLENIVLSIIILWTRAKSTKYQGWRQEFFDGGLTLPTRGLKYGFQGNINTKNLQNNRFSPSDGGSMLRRGAIAPYPSPGATPAKYQP